MIRRWLILCSVLAVTACSNDLDQDTEPADDAAQPDTGAAAPGAADSVPGIDATLAEWSVALSRDSAAAGAVTFHVRNTGSVPHAFEVEGGGQEWATEPIAPGGNVTMSVQLAAGEYKVYCPITADTVSHERKGMVTRLRVY